jgi:hypothetical protein
MKRFTDAGRRAIADKNDYAALSLALMIPDICGSLEDPGPGKSQERYERGLNDGPSQSLVTYLRRNAINFGVA